MRDFFDKLLGFFDKDEIKTIHRLTEFIQSKLSNKEIDFQSLPAWLSTINPKLVGLDDDSHKIVTYFCESVIEMLNNPDSLQYLLAKTLEYQPRHLAFIYIGWLGSKASSALPFLIDVVGDGGEEANDACDAIILIGNAEEKIISALENKLKNQDDLGFRKLCSLAIRTSLSSSLDFWKILVRGAINPISDMREIVADYLPFMDIIFREDGIILLRKLQNDEFDNVQMAASEAINKLLAK